MNPALKTTAYLDKVGPDTETKYSDAFFQVLQLKQALINSQEHGYHCERTR